MSEELNKVYAERDMCVALIARMANLLGWKTDITQHQGEEWEDEWRNVVIIQLPTGQVSWHIHDSEKEWFSEIRTFLLQWDGHTTEEKYRRVLAMVQHPKVAYGTKVEHV